MVEQLTDSTGGNRFGVENVRKLKISQLPGATEEAECICCPSCPPLANESVLVFRKATFPVIVVEWKFHTMVMPRGQVSHQVGWGQLVSLTLSAQTMEFNNVEEGTREQGGGEGK